MSLIPSTLATTSGKHPARAALWPALVCAAALWLPAQLAAQTAVHFDSQPGSRLTIDGTSTVHDWSVEGNLIGGSFEVDEAFLKDPATKDLKIKPKVDVSIMVRTLKSGKRPMDSIMQDALKMAQHPKIEYKLNELTLKTPPERPGAPATFTAKGELTVAGVKKNIEMPVTVERPERDKLKFTGVANLKMTDFGIQPPAPSLALGLIKTGDDVKVSFQWLTSLRAPAAQ